MTLREALMASDLDKVYAAINKRDSDISATRDRPSLKQTVHAYAGVVKELLCKQRVRAYYMPWLVKESVDILDGHKYADVCYLNPKYVKPPKGLKPWGGYGKNPKIPKGYYNCNDNKHSQTFAVGWTPWSKVIDTQIINEAGFPVERLVAEILWEMTFYGWTEDRADQSVKQLKGRLKDALKEIKSGKCIEIPPKKKGGFKIVIPDSVSGQIVDIVNKEAKRRKKNE